MILHNKPRLTVVTPTPSSVIDSRAVAMHKKTREGYRERENEGWRYQQVVEIRRRIQPSFLSGVFAKDLMCVCGESIHKEGLDFARALLAQHVLFIQRMDR